MPDNKQVLDPGWRALDANGDPYSGAKLKFFEADGITPRTVYEDGDLSSSLSAVVTCDSGGYPTSDGNAKTLIFTGLNDFVIKLYTNADVFVWTHEEPGALDTSGFGGDTRITSPVVSVSTDQVLAFSDSGKLYNVNCSGGPVVFTLGAATSLEDGWRVGIRHNGALPSVATAANQVKIVTTGGDLIALPDLISTTAFSIISKGQEAWIRCDGSGFSVGETTPPLLNTTGVITIADRLSAPPGSPAPGARYLVGTTPTGDWSTFTQHDIAEANGNGGWFKITPAADCGWIAYVQDEDIYYRFRASAWVKEFAEQADMEAASSLNLQVPPGMQKFHPMHAKAWGYADVSGNLLAGSGISSVTDGGAGICTFNLTTPMSSATNYLAIGHMEQVGVGRAAHTISPKTASAVEVRSSNYASALSDGSAYGVLVFGDLA